ncbi:hypothetical protein Agabi119p4_3345 [Agaricus bisporus var. burnettii]|uniref:Mnn4-regulates the mannosylphosphorylation n=1 Tax=Agaricus bisporus var. burnettii TaxID=192524 RepID=A0A8H7KIV2_AGABI|nr:hypothetical protein Agabi119p4_3345 [Agaricus bisporus var. burnettii]
MNPLFRQSLRASAYRLPSALGRSAIPALRRPMPIARPVKIITSPLMFQKRMVASSVSNKPASQSFEHAATNLKEELGGTASDVAKIIAGANVTQDAVTSDAGVQSFLGITTKNLKAVPEPVLMLGLVGGLPYVGSSLTTIWLAREASLAIHGVTVGIDPGVALTVLDQALNFQVTYGAVMLSFLGALHWGMEMAAYGGQKGYTRLALGTAPMLLAWSTLGGMQPTMALVVQWVGFTGLWYADSKATMAGWTPKWYSQYRFYLSILVGVCIIGSLAGCSYWGPVAGHGLLTHDLDLLREERKKYLPEQQHAVTGNIEAVPASEDAERYTVIRKRKSDEESE